MMLMLRKPCKVLCVITGSLGSFLNGNLCIKEKFYVLPTQCICVLCGSENKQRLFPYTTLTDWFL